MNARQAKKVLKRQIRELKSDNDLMRSVIADSPSMQELYDLHKKPLNVITSTMDFEQYRAKKSIPNDIVYINDIEYLKERVAYQLFDGIKDSIIYEVHTKGGITGITEITASIFIGRK